jgi:hypothetical protein
MGDAAVKGNGHGAGLIELLAAGVENHRIRRQVPYPEPAVTVAVIGQGIAFARNITALKEAYF